MSKASTPVRVLIVDDEPAARELVREMLKEGVESGTVQVVGECEDGRAAIHAIQFDRPDLVFLDIQMPEIDGFEVLSQVAAEQLPFIIFVTAFDQYALRAFEVHALDYLLKPFDRERFEHVFERAKQVVARERKGELSERILTLLEERGVQVSPAASSQQYLERLVIKTDGRVFFLRADEIEWIEAQGNYVALHVGKRAHLYREPISSLETQLDPNTFRRIHRSAIVNIDCIKELQPMFRGEYLVIMRDGKELKLSHSYRDRLQQLP